MDDNALYKLEQRNSSLLITGSDAKGLYYATEPDSECLVMFVDSKIARQKKGANRIVLTREQAYAAWKELGDILTFIGRGKISETRGRRHL